MIHPIIAAPDGTEADPASNARRIDPAAASYFQDCQHPGRPPVG
jgi:hypothetical protein